MRSLGAGFSIREKLIKIGTQVIERGWHVTFQSAGLVMPMKTYPAEFKKFIETPRRDCHNPPHRFSAPQPKEKERRGGKLGF